MAFANTSSEVFSAGAGLFQSSKRPGLAKLQNMCVDVRFSTNPERSKFKRNVCLCIFFGTCFSYIAPASPSTWFHVVIVLQCPVQSAYEATRVFSDPFGFGHVWKFWLMLLKTQFWKMIILEFFEAFVFGNFDHLKFMTLLMFQKIGGSPLEISVKQMAEMGEFASQLRCRISESSTVVPVR